MWRVTTLLLGITACYEPSYRDCEVTCAADTDCAPGHTFDAAFEARMDGALRGALQYVARTNNHADCAALTGCTSRSDLSAVRAPQ